MRARPILFVDDYPLQLGFSKQIKRRLGREVVHVKTFDEAVARLERPCEHCGLLLDIELSKTPGAPTGFDVLAVARRHEPQIAAAMLTGKLEPELVTRAARLGALYVPKSGDVMEALEHFFVAAIAYDGDGTLDAAVDRVLARIGIESDLVAARVLRLHAHGLASTEVQERLRISHNTYKSHCRRLCRARDSDQVLDLVREIWREHTSTKA